MGPNMLLFLWTHISSSLSITAFYIFKQFLSLCSWGRDNKRSWILPLCLACTSKCLLVDILTLHWTCRAWKHIWGEALLVNFWDTTKNLTKVTSVCLLLLPFPVLVDGSFLWFEWSCFLHAVLYTLHTSDKYRNLTTCLSRLGALLPAKVLNSKQIRGGAEKQV